MNTPIVVTEISTHITSDLSTVTDKINPYLTLGTVRVPQEYYSVYISSTGKLGVVNRNLEPGKYTLHRNTYLDPNWVMNIHTFDSGLREVYQYLQDHFTLDIANELFTIFREKFNLELTDHLVSFHADDPEKPPKNPPFGKRRKTPPEVVASDILFGYLVKYPLSTISYSPYSGLSRFISDNSITPIKEISYDSTALTFSITLGKFLYDPQKESQQSVLYRFADNVQHARIFFGKLEITPDINEGIGEVVLSGSLLTNIDPCYLGIEINGEFIPLKVFTIKQRVFP